jgi:hypothetical protein
MGSKRILGAIGFTALWFKNNYGIVETDPFETDPDKIAEWGVQKSKILYQRYPNLPLGSPDPEPVYTGADYGSHMVCSTAFGGPMPIWDPDSCSWWQPETYSPWSYLETPADVAAIKMPDWNEVELVRRKIQRYERILKKTGGKVDYPNEAMVVLNHPVTGETYRFTAFPTFIDLGPVMCGREKFMMILAGEPELAHALLDKCFEMSTSYCEFMCRTFGIKKVEGLMGFGGDFSGLLSPRLYREYALDGFDRMLVERYGNIPANLHSCAPSKHLYGVWAFYPHRENIILMQTRGIRGELKRLRKALPHTLLQITLLPPQFDFERETEENIRSIMWEFAEDAGFRDIQIVSYITAGGEVSDRNIRVFYDTVEEINSTASRG